MNSLVPGTLALRNDETAQQKPLETEKTACALVGAEPQNKSVMVAEYAT